MAEPRTRHLGLAIGMFGSAVVLAAVIGSQFGPSATYATLAKPSWNPPGWLFGPVWTTLYVMIAAAGVLAFRHSPSRRISMALWWCQIVLNGIWSPVFFGWHQRWLAFGIIVTLLMTIITFIVWHARRVRTAAWLFVPYAAWVSFASVLNATIAALN